MLLLCHLQKNSNNDNDNDNNKTKLMFNPLPSKSSFHFALKTHACATTTFSFTSSLVLASKELHDFQKRFLSCIQKPACKAPGDLEDFWKTWKWKK